MIRRYFLAIISLMIIGAMIFGYQKFKRFNTPVSPILSAVPKGSALIIETADATKLWEKLTHTSVIWEELKQFEAVRESHRIGHLIDSLLQNDQLLYKQLQTKKAMAVLAPSGAERYSLLFGVNTPANWTAFKVKEIIAQFVPENSEMREREYDETTLFTVFHSGENILHWAHYEGILILCNDNIPVEDALRQIKAPQNLPNEKEFAEMAKTAGLFADANVYINYSQIKNLTAAILSDRGKKSPVFKDELAGWAALDLTAKSSQLMLNGFVHVSDSSNHFLRVFKGQKPRPLGVSRVLPPNTAHLMFYGLSHFPTFYQEYTHFLREANHFFSYEKAIDAFNSQTGENVADRCLSWISQEIALAVTEPSSDDFRQHAYLILSTSDTDHALEQLKRMSTALGFEPITYSHSETTAFELRLGNAYEKLLGEAFHGFDEIVAASVDDYVIVAPSRSAMRNLLNYYSTGNTLHRVDHFASFAENLSDKSNLVIYSGISRSPELYSLFLSPSWKNLINEKTELIRNFEGFAWQIIQSDDGRFFNNIYLRHNPVYTKESGAFWELALDTAITSGPQLVVNHYTNSREILVQDANDVLHLISNTGKILWSKKLDGPMIGQATQIDRYKNQKLQMLLTTADKLYLLDRNGNHVDGFPVALKSQATSAPAVFDYDNSRDYRIMLPTANRSARMFDAAGKAVKGWNPVTTDDIVSDQPRHLRLGNKDYLFATDRSGKIYLLNRRGEHRHKVKTGLTARTANPVFIQQGKSITHCKLLYTDTLGNLVSLGFDNKESRVNLNTSATHGFTTSDLDLDGKPEILITDSEGLRVFDIEGDELCEIELGGATSQATVHPGNDQRSTIAVLQKDESALFFLDSQCRLKNDFPLFAQGKFTLGDINKDGVLNAVAIGEANTLYVYNLD